MVSDCREVSLEHKRLNLLAPVGSKESEILEEIAPRENEIVLSKGASGVFNSTAIDQILRNLGVATLIISGVVTNYCVETAVRDAGDRGYNVILVSDGCAAMSAEHQRLALEILDGIYCVVRSTDHVLRELRGGTPLGDVQARGERTLGGDGRGGLGGASASVVWHCSARPQPQQPPGLKGGRRARRICLCGAHAGLDKGDERP